MYCKTREKILIGNIVLEHLIWHHDTILEKLSLRRELLEKRKVLTCMWGHANTSDAGSAMHAAVTDVKNFQYTNCATIQLYIHVCMYSIFE